MLKGLGLLILLTLTMTVASAGQVYRWVDERGRVYYSDQPPPPKVREAQTLKPRPSVVETDKEGFEMRRAREANPVVLYITDCGEPCDQAREFLAQRKIPFTRKDPQRVPEDAVALKQLVGVLEVPVIQVGGKHQKGFDPAAWEGLLSAAGYPVRTEAKGP
ncbi:MAG: glutaredoxin family protein [Thiobacillaceae bacterium]